MRTAALLVGLLLLASCRSTDPWDEAGWRNEQLDFETDFWVPIDEGQTTAPPPTARPPATRPTQPPVQPSPTWTQPGPGGMPPPPPPPPPPYTPPSR